MQRSKIKWLFLLLISLNVFTTSAQNKTSEETYDIFDKKQREAMLLKEQGMDGVMITKQDDTLKCLVRLPSGSLNDLYYMAYKKGSDSTIEVKENEIKSITTAYFYIERIYVGGKEKLMFLVAGGKITLYSYAKDYRVLYVAVKNNKYLEINKKTFKVLLRHLTFDYPELVKKIDKRGYEYDDIIKIINEYNKRFQ
ncbi:MAG: hypothetical protein ABIP35_11935 [Ginsengibacter sp.]